MANNENKASKAAEAPKEERVEIFIEKGYANDDPNLFVSVNGVNYLLPKGKTSKVPPEVKAEIDRSIKAQEALDNRKDEMIAKAK